MFALRFFYEKQNSRFWPLIILVYKPQPSTACSPHHCAALQDGGAVQGVCKLYMVYKLCVCLQTMRSVYKRCTVSTNGAWGLQLCTVSTNCAFGIDKLCTVSENCARCLQTMQSVCKFCTMSTNDACCLQTGAQCLQIVQRVYKLCMMPTNSAPRGGWRGAVSTNVRAPLGSVGACETVLLTLPPTPSSYALKCLQG